MKRLAIMLTVVGALSLVGATSARGSDWGYHGYSGHGAYTQPGGHGHENRFYRNGRGHGHRYPSHHDGHGYGQYSHGGQRGYYERGHHDYRYGHGIIIRTPHFGFRIGH